jgi:membrane protein implicated in regulation of membrane protease activity
MNRKAFLTTVAALFTAPFLSKGEKQPSQEETKTAEDIVKHFKVPPALLSNNERVTFVGGNWTIKGADLQYILDNKR